jgi:hypothetical protein
LPLDGGADDEMTDALPEPRSLPAFPLVTDALCIHKKRPSRPKRTKRSTGRKEIVIANVMILSLIVKLVAFLGKRCSTNCNFMLLMRIK